MKLGLRLGLGFGIVVVLLLMISIMGAHSISNLSGQVNVLVHDRFPKTVWANDIIDAVNVTARVSRNSLLLTNPEDIRKELARIPEQAQLITDRFDKLTAAITSEKGKELLKKSQELRA
ncbi:MAG TPA: MCP four helix bundle domain-containing protein, partial [Rhodocyclaceae bacterium]|nr:MCP four helix bundle domain-containing protein [Rhodocyclaceae bacterium]